MNIISDKNKEIANWAMQYALDLGCKEVRITLATASSNSFEYRDTQLDELESNTENSLYIEVFINQKYGSFSSNRLDKGELARFIAEGIDSVKYLSEDIHRRLPDSLRYYKSDDTDLDIFDKTFYSISTDEKLTVTRNAADEIYGTHPNIISVSANYSDSISSTYMIASNGFEHQENKTYFSLLVNVSLKTTKEARSEAFWYDYASHWKDLQKTGIGKTVLEKALQKVGQEKIASGKYEMLLDNMTSTKLLSPIISAISGGAIQQKNSFLINKIGEKIVSDKVTIIDQPHQLRMLGSRLYDGEGVATKERTVVEKGILKTYFIDTYNSSKLGMEPTIASSSGLCMQMGNKNCEELIESVSNGIWVTGFNGGNTNPTTGDFSFGIEGFLIENGKITKPVSEMNITGNLLTLWNNVAEIGNDPKKNSSTKIPSILFKDVSFSGL